MHAYGSALKTRTAQKIRLKSQFSTSKNRVLPGTWRWRRWISFFLGLKISSPIRASTVVPGDQIQIDIIKESLIKIHQKSFNFFAFISNLFRHSKTADRWKSTVHLRQCVDAARRWFEGDSSISQICSEYLNKWKTLKTVSVRNSRAFA